jgi:hypothetical protein
MKNLTIRKAVACIAGFATMVAVLIVLDHWRDSRNDNDGRQPTVVQQVVNPAYLAAVSPRRITREQAHRWSKNQVNRILDGRAGHTDGTRSANHANAKFRDAMLDGYRAWYNRQVRTAKAEGRRCCGIPDPTEWIDDFMQNMRGTSACHVTAPLGKTVQQLDCAADVMDDIVVHPIQSVIDDAAECTVGVPAGAVVKKTVEIKWRQIKWRMIGGVLRRTVHTRWTWLIDHPQSLNKAMLICMGTQYLLRALR